MIDAFKMITLGEVNEVLRQILLVAQVVFDMTEGVDHIGIATHSLDAHSKFGPL